MLNQVVVNKAAIIPVWHQHVSIISVSMPTLASSSAVPNRSPTVLLASATENFVPLTKAEVLNNAEKKNVARG